MGLSPTWVTWDKSCSTFGCLGGFSGNTPILPFEKQCRPHKRCKNYLSRDVRKPDFCICENKDADQLRGNREADQRLCFRYTDSTITLLLKYKVSSL